MHQPDYKKKPGGKLNYIFDFANTTNGGDEQDWLEAGETIVTAVITPTTDITILNSSINIAGNQVEVWVADGLKGATYTIECTITTNKAIPTTTEFRTAVKELLITIT